MKEKFKEENKIIEHLKLLKKHGRLDKKAICQAIDALSEPGNHNLLREYLEEQAVDLANIVLNGKPFPLPDETADGPIRFAITENSRFIGLYPEECHVLIAGQTGTGKSTLLKIIFAQALLINDRERQGNGENNLLAIR